MWYLIPLIGIYRENFEILDTKGISSMCPPRIILIIIVSSQCEKPLLLYRVAANNTALRS
jgi:hypothetical protein